MNGLVFTDFYDTCEDAPGDTVAFTYNGTPYTHEAWSTRHTSGSDFYDTNGALVEPPFKTDELIDEFEGLANDLRAHYYAQINPARANAARNAVAALNNAD